MLVEVAYAGVDKQSILQLEIPQDSTLGQAIELSGILELYPEIGPNASVGIFGKPRSLEWLLKAGDRVEIYRPLLIQPKDARIKRAKQQKAKKSKG